MEETFTIINELIEYMKCRSSNDLVEQFQYQLKEIAEQNNICPNCGGELVIKGGKQSYLSEAWGTNVYEKEIIRSCSNCGWKEC